MALSRAGPLYSSPDAKTCGVLTGTAGHLWSPSTLLLIKSGPVTLLVRKKRNTE